MVLWSKCDGGDGSLLDQRTRSEEHTSELQSHSDLVCRLLLEKKKIVESCGRVGNCARTSSTLNTTPSLWYNYKLEQAITDENSSDPMIRQHHIVYDRFNHWPI